MKNNLDNWFEEQRNCFDIAEPAQDHEVRFLDKLNGTTVNKTPLRKLNWWRPLAAAAAVLVLVFAGYSSLNTPVNADLATVSPEMAKTQDFFTKAIEEELYNLNEARTPQTQKLVNDALKQLKVLESDYSKLTKDLTESGEDKRVIYAMISNFQARINLLTSVLEEIESIKNTDYENQLL
ncbi:hypothetical protein [Leeuwenhoekiella sp. NPDC079379]|uniref:hypothetical protein n=1 Tax=Leeuwenhoekiella sp. NPDC079379 TaxID=3364122 RepID=UPI0037C84BBD